MALANKGTLLNIHDYYCFVLCLLLTIKMICDNPYLILVMVDSDVLSGHCKYAMEEISCLIIYCFYLIKNGRNKLS